MHFTRIMLSIVNLYCNYKFILSFTLKFIQKLCVDLFLHINQQIKHENIISNSAFNIFIIDIRRN